MGLLDSATNAVNTAANTFTSSGPASALSGIANSVSGAISSVSSFFQSLTGGKSVSVKLPLPNPLFAYASYTYNLAIGCLTDDQLNNPDTTYMAGQKIALVARDANGDPNNRVVTPYGKFDFMIDNVELKSQIGLDAGNTTNVTNITFNITEPYSMGLFMIACQTVAQKNGHQNFREAPFVLVIDFRGNRENGQMTPIPGTKRFIPFNFSDVTMTCNEQGSKYHITAMPYQQQGFSDANAKFPSDVSVKGTTVQEVLQTGEKSLQAVINKRLKQLEEQKIVAIADEIIILFPQDIASASVPAQSPDGREDNTGATSSSEQSGSKAIQDKLGVSRSNKNQTLIQATGDCNVIGKASLGFDETRKGSTPVGQDNKVWDEKKQIWLQGNNTINVKESDFKFTQDTDIPNAINQVILASNYVKDALDPACLSPEGYRGWWRIDVQVYNVSSDANMTSTGTKPKIIVYRVVPYAAHASRLMPPNTQAPGFDNLKKQAIKEYNYIYTGKNVDVEKFEIKINAGFMNIMGADGLQKSQDIKTAASQGGTEEEQQKIQPMPQGSAPSGIPGAMSSIVKYIGTTFGSDKKGGGGQETEATRAARIFMDAVTTGTDLYDLEMDIIGDPYFIVQSGMGNYTAGSTSLKNLNDDGTVNYQNGEVDVMVNFRTPVDINQSTGLYDFGSKGKTAPLIQYSGLYCVTEVTSKFSNGLFKQHLSGFRRPLQENLFAATPDQTFNSSNPAPKPTTEEETP